MTRTQLSFSGLFYRVLTYFTLASVISLTLQPWHAAFTKPIPQTVPAETTAAETEEEADLSAKWNEDLYAPNQSTSIQPKVTQTDEPPKPSFYMKRATLVPTQPGNAPRVTKPVFIPGQTENAALLQKQILAEKNAARKEQKPEKLQSTEQSTPQEAIHPSKPPKALKAEKANTKPAAQTTPQAIPVEKAATEKQDASSSIRAQQGTQPEKKLKVKHEKITPTVQQAPQSAIAPMPEATSATQALNPDSKPVSEPAAPKHKKEKLAKKLKPKKAPKTETTLAEKTKEPLVSPSQVPAPESKMEQAVKTAQSEKTPKAHKVKQPKQQSIAKKPATSDLSEQLSKAAEPTGQALKSQLPKQTEPKSKKQKSHKIKTAKVKDKPIPLPNEPVDVHPFPGQETLSASAQESIATPVESANATAAQPKQSKPKKQKRQKEKQAKSRQEKPFPLPQNPVAVEAFPTAVNAERTEDDQVFASETGTSITDPASPPQKRQSVKKISKFKSDQPDPLDTRSKEHVKKEKIKKQKLVIAKTEKAAQPHITAKANSVLKSDLTQPTDASTSVSNKQSEAPKSASGIPNVKPEKTVQPKKQKKIKAPKTKPSNVETNELDKQQVTKPVQESKPVPEKITQNPPENKSANLKSQKHVKKSKAPKIQAATEFNPFPTTEQAKDSMSASALAESAKPAATNHSSTKKTKARKQKTQPELTQQAEAITSNPTEKPLQEKSAKPDRHHQKKIKAAHATALAPTASEITSVPTPNAEVLKAATEPTTPSTASALEQPDAPKPAQKVKKQKPQKADKSPKSANGKNSKNIEKPGKPTALEQEDSPRAPIQPVTEAPSSKQSKEKPTAQTMVLNPVKPLDATLQPNPMLNLPENPILPEKQPVLPVGLASEQPATEPIEKPAEALTAPTAVNAATASNINVPQIAVAKQKAAEYNALLTQRLQSPKAGSFETILQKGQEAAVEILKVIDSLDEPTYQELGKQMPGYLQLRDQVIVVAPDPAFFLEQSKKHGTPTDVVFFTLMSQTLNGYWPVTMEQLTDLSGCTRFGTHDLIRLYGAWTDYRKHHPNAYQSAFQDPNLLLLSDIEDQLLNSQAACEGPETVMNELDTFIKTYPHSAVTPKVKARLDALRKNSSDMVFYQGVKHTLAK